jgi:hypothetical protein
VERLSLTSIRYGSYDPVPGVVPTYLQFDQKIRARWHKNNPHRGRDASYRALSEVELRRQWLTYIIGRYDRGALVPDGVWRMLTAGQREAFLASPRAQLGRVTSYSETPNRAPRLPLDDAGDPRRVTRRTPGGGRAARPGRSGGSGTPPSTSHTPV